MNENIKVKISTVVRTTMLAIAVINQILIMNGKQILPIQEETLSEFISTFTLISVSIWSWWKNNSFTKAALKADIYLNELKK